MGVFSRGAVEVGTSLLLTLLDWAFSALHVHAAAATISGLGIALGFLALIVPGIILSLRWVVVAQAAAIEHEGWLSALRRSRDVRSPGGARGAPGARPYITSKVS